jgi:hypothetical protein
LKTFLPGLETLEKLKIYLKLRSNLLFLTKKFITNIYYWNNWNKLIVTGTRDEILILPGLGPEKVENHCSKAITTFPFFHLLLASLLTCLLVNIKTLLADTSRQQCTTHTFSLSPSLSHTHIHTF